uniref:Uncharacterized protein n=1 Tax=Opuntia streptacantha TaxID=393608 RepID=A0A7C9AY68_OPUST
MGNSRSKKARALPVDSPFDLPSLLPHWPPGGEFASGTVDLGGLIVAEVTSFNKVWTAYEGGPDNSGATFFEPTGIPQGFSILGYYAQPNNRHLFGSDFLRVVQSLPKEVLGEDGPTGPKMKKNWYGDEK